MSRIPGPATAAEQPQPLRPANAQQTARINFQALHQWSGTGKVKRSHTASHHRRYRLGRWHLRSTSCSWNPPHPENSPAGDPPCSVDISRKPSESRRSSIISTQSPWAPNTGDSDPEDGPLAQMLLRENDEIWNNSGYRFTFYSPTTGTVRATDVRNLRTDKADGLDELIRQAHGTASSDKASSIAVAAADSGNGSNHSMEGSSGGVQGMLAQSAGAMAPPQVSVTSVDSVPKAEGQQDTGSIPDSEFLHPNYAPPRNRTESTSSRRHGPRTRPRSSPIDAQSIAGSAEDVDSRPSRLFWLDIMDPTDAEITALARIFDLHPLTCEELMVMKTPSGMLAQQDSFKSFHHYDIACYRTSVLRDDDIGDRTAQQVDGNGLAVMRGSDYGDERSTLRRRRSFLRDSPSVRSADAAAAIASWEKEDDVEEAMEERIDIEDVEDEKYDATRRRSRAGSLRQRLGSLLIRPPLESTDAPEISVPPSFAASRPLSTYRVPGNVEQSSEEGVVPFYVIVLDSGVITLHLQNVPHVRNTIARLMLDEEVVDLTPYYIVYLLLDDITDTLVPLTRMLEVEVDAVDELVLILSRAEHDDVLKRIGIERRHALWLVRLLHGKGEVLRSIDRCVHAKADAMRMSVRRHRNTMLAARHNCSSSDEEDEHKNVLDTQVLTSDEEEGVIYGGSRIRLARADRPPPVIQQQQLEVTKYLADVHDHLIALTASVHHCERILARAHGNYLARINLELTHASNTTNQLATQMTVLAGIFLPLNLVAGIFGMNVKVPGRDRDDLRDFGIILGAMAAFVVIALARDGGMWHLRKHTILSIPGLSLVALTVAYAVAFFTYVGVAQRRNRMVRRNEYAEAWIALVGAILGIQALFVISAYRSPSRYLYWTVPWMGYGSVLAVLSLCVCGGYGAVGSAGPAVWGVFWLAASVAIVVYAAKARRGYMVDRLMGIPECRPLLASSRGAELLWVVFDRVVPWATWVVGLFLGLLVAIQALSLANDHRLYKTPGLLVPVQTQGGEQWYKLHVWCFGYDSARQAGQPVFVLLNEFGMPSTAMMGLAQGIADSGHPACIVDRPGYGWSEPGHWDQDPIDVVKSINQALTKYPIDNPLILVGWGEGGVWAQLYMQAADATRVVGMVLLDTYPNHEILQTFALNRTTTLQNLRQLRSASINGSSDKSSASTIPEVHFDKALERAASRTFSNWRAASPLALHRARNSKWPGFQPQDSLGMHRSLFRNNAYYQAKYFEYGGTGAKLYQALLPFATSNTDAVLVYHHWPLRWPAIPQGAGSAFTSKSALTRRDGAAPVNPASDSTLPVVIIASAKQLNSDCSVQGIGDSELCTKWQAFSWFYYRQQVEYQQTLSRNAALLLCSNKVAEDDQICDEDFVWRRPKWLASALVAQIIAQDSASSSVPTATSTASSSSAAHTSTSSASVNESPSPTSNAEQASESSKGTATSLSGSDATLASSSTVPTEPVVA
ncbi:CorA metal ion transporter [Coemansia sp. Benny D115]|nr:CorA metal ion transporter [Coemansia sp. Benny D115]